MCGDVDHLVDHSADEQDRLRQDRRHFVGYRGAEGVDGVRHRRDDAVYGSAGADTIFAGQGADTVHGGEGDDVIRGDLGNDVLFGEGGADVFVIMPGSGQDVIRDFDGSQDDIDLTMFGFTDYNDFIFSSDIAFTASGAEIDLGGGAGVTIAGAGSLSQDWFLL